MNQSADWLETLYTFLNIFDTTQLCQQKRFDVEAHRPGKAVFLCKLQSLSCKLFLIGLGIQRGVMDWVKVVECVIWSVLNVGF